MVRHKFTEFKECFPWYVILYYSSSVLLFIVVVSDKQLFDTFSLFFCCVDNNRSPLAFIQKSDAMKLIKPCPSSMLHLTGDHSAVKTPSHFRQLYSAIV